MLDEINLENKLFVVGNKKEKQTVDLSKIIVDTELQSIISNPINRADFEDIIIEHDSDTKMVLSVLLCKEIVTMMDFDDNDDGITFQISKNPLIGIDADTLTRKFRERFESFKNNIASLMFFDYMRNPSMTAIVGTILPIFQSIFV